MADSVPRRGDDFVVTTSSRETTPVVAPHGEVDIATADEFGQAVLAASAKADRIEIDLSDTTFMDARGLAVIVGARHCLGDSQRSVVVSNPSTTALLALSASGVDGLVTVRIASSTRRSTRSSLRP